MPTLEMIYERDAKITALKAENFELRARITELETANEKWAEKCRKAEQYWRRAFDLWQTTHPAHTLELAEKALIEEAKKSVGIEKSTAEVIKVRSRQKRLQEMRQSAEYRDGIVENEVKLWLSFQLRQMRNDKGWTQKDLAKRLGTSANVISRLEHPDYGKVTLATLLKIASAFECGLVVKFAGLQEFMDAYQDVRPEAMKIKEGSDANTTV